MAIRPIRLIGDPVLRTQCETIKTINKDIKQLIKDLLDTTKLEGRAGVAANQIGVPLRAFSLNIEGQTNYLINPEIVFLSKELQTQIEEGCLSIPDKWYKTPRSVKAICQGIDLNGQEKIIKGEGLLARALQHECDHLDGKLYIDRLKGSVKRQALSEIINNI
ncbi:MAG: peptide deformylase [Bifidobacteriaceae bacterium]|jgi:peptide deformylase|nr:peptide deformylase [Bifidobacteriaceae bacterium]